MLTKTSKFSFLILYLFCYVSAHHRNDLCGNHSEKIRSCTKQILGHDNIDTNICKMEITANSTECNKMKFSPIQNNTQIGSVSLRPYIYPVQLGVGSYVNYTILNITFGNIKWKKMRFRFENYKTKKNHCRTITISNDGSINDQSVLYYDCYSSTSDVKYNGQSHLLDFEATDDKVINSGQFYFNVPTVQMLSPEVTIREWKPFVYVQILIGAIRLHILKPPFQLKIPEYKIALIRNCGSGSGPLCEEIIVNTTLYVHNDTLDEVYYDYALPNNMFNQSLIYYFRVAPIHEECRVGLVNCQFVESPKIVIKNIMHQNWSICIASVTALVVASLFASYVALKFLRRHWCRDGVAIPPPTKILVVYSSVNRLHAECVSSFVNFLRTEYGFDMMYDGDIVSTSHGDPYRWAEDTFQLASHILYIVGPSDYATNDVNIYEKPIIPAHKDVDLILLALIKTARVSKCQKEIYNVFFEHSSGDVPLETKHFKRFYLLKDWNRLIAYLSKNLLPKLQIMRSEKGKCFLDDLAKAKKLINKGQNNIMQDVKVNVFDKKILL